MPPLYPSEHPPAAATRVPEEQHLSEQPRRPYRSNDPISIKLTKTLTPPLQHIISSDNTSMAHPFLPER